MLTLEEILADVAASPSFQNAGKITVNTRGNEGQSPLHWMATLGDAPAIRLLLEAGADINARDNNDNTPLHEAVIFRQTSAARVLIERGADLRIKNSQALTPLRLAESDGFRPIIELLNGAQQH